MGAGVVEVTRAEEALTVVAVVDTKVALATSLEVAGKDSGANLESNLGATPTIVAATSSKKTRNLDKQTQGQEEEDCSAFDLLRT